MWRGNLSDDNKRIKNFIKDKKKIIKLFNSLLKEKKICGIYVFPYTTKFLIESISFNIFDGVCIYRNPVEKNYEKLIKKFKKIKFLDIRPFGGKLKLNKKHKLNFLLNYSINCKNIENIILTCSKKKQIREIVSYCNDKKNF